MPRRGISIVCYVFAGLLLATEGVLAFMDDGDKIGALLLSSVLAAVPLGIGLALTPGRRIREAGIVLMAGAGWVALSALNFLYLSMREDMRDFLPRRLFAMFDDYALGGINFALMAGLGLVLFLRGGRTGRPA